MIKSQLLPSDFDLSSNTPMLVLKECISEPLKTLCSGWTWLLKLRYIVDVFFVPQTNTRPARHTVQMAAVPLYLLQVTESEKKMLKL